MMTCWESRGIRKKVEKRPVTTKARHTCVKQIVAEED
jgi:hypothetical protein